MGWAARRQGAVVAPSLKEHVATNLRGEAAVAKEARKAQEGKKSRLKPQLKGQKGAGKGSEEAG